MKTVIRYVLVEINFLAISISGLPKTWYGPMEKISVWAEIGN